MSEQLKPMDFAVKHLLEISIAATKQGDRFIITNHGEPQFVIVSYDDYRGMQAAIELLDQPEKLEDIRAGLSEIAEGKRLTSEQFKKRIQDAALNQNQVEESS